MSNTASEDGWGGRGVVAGQRKWVRTRVMVDIINGQSWQVLGWQQRLQRKE
jgi:hypothetical protein